MSWDVIDVGKSKHSPTMTMFLGSEPKVFKAIFRACFGFTVIQVKGKQWMRYPLRESCPRESELAGPAPTTSLAYFSCDNKDSRRKIATAILRGLVYQLICQRPDLCVYLRDQYDKQKEQLFSSPNSVYALWRDISEYHRPPKS